MAPKKHDITRQLLHELEQQVYSLVTVVMKSEFVIPTQHILFCCAKAYVTPQNM